MKKLIVLSYDFPPRHGGIARLCQEISSGMLGYFEDVLVLTRKSNDTSITYNYNSIERIEFSEKRIQCEREILVYLSGIKKKSEYVVLCGVWHPEGMLAILAGFKNVFSLGHGTEFLSGASRFRKKIWLPYYGGYMLKSLAGVICNSHYTQQLVNNIQGKTKSSVLPLAVNHNFFKPSKVKTDDNILNIATVSRIEKFKGHDFILKVLASLPQSIKERIKWNIVGKGPDLPYLKKLVEELEMNEVVTFLGFIDDSDLPTFYNENDLFVLCSRESDKTMSVEGFGLVFLEAQSCGIPVVGTDTGGISDAIENLNGGWLIKQDNEEELKNILMKVFHNRDFLKLQGVNARKRVEQFCTWEQYNRQLYNILSSV